MANGTNKQATVVVQAITPASANKSGRIKTDKGMFGVWKDKAGAFTVGETYEIGYAETYKANVCYRDVRTVKHLGPYTPTREQKAAEMDRRGQNGKPAPKPTPKRAMAAAAAPAADSVRQSDVLLPSNEYDAPLEPPMPESPTDYGLRDDRYWKPKPRHPVEQEQIFVAMGLKCDIERGRVSDEEDELVERVELWRRVWQRTFGQSLH